MNAGASEPDEQNESPERSERPRRGWEEWFAAEVLPLREFLPKWAIQLALLALLIILAWRLATATVDLSAFQFTDLLALLMAFFAIALSAAFYFKATEAGNRFYDNTYKFTREIALILARIEERFGERLEHLHESYTGIQRQVERVAASGGVVDPETLKEQIRQEEEKKEQSERERQKIIDELTEKAELEKAEKTEVMLRLLQLQEEVERARSEIDRLRIVQRLAEVNGGLEKSAQSPMGDIYRYVSNGRWHDEVMHALAESRWSARKLRTTLLLLEVLWPRLSRGTTKTIESKFAQGDPKMLFPPLSEFLHRQLLNVELREPPPEV